MTDNIVPIRPAGSVEIDSGIVTSSIVTDAEGSRSIPSEIGQHRFFVEVVEPDGTRQCLWDGADYREARRQAVELSRSYGPIQDNTTEGGAT